MSTLALIEAARAAIRPHLLQTPVLLSEPLSAMLGQPVYLKLDNLQITGSFKVRGALFRLLHLGPETRTVTTCSAGNHGKGLAWAARLLGIEAVVHVPSSVDQAKAEGIAALGAQVRRSRFIGYDDTELVAREDAARTGTPFISAFDDPHIMAGNGGTLALEVMEQVPAARTFILPVSGGGLAGGFAVAARHHLPDATLIAVQHAECRALSRSLEEGRAITRMPEIETLAGGLEGGLGALPFAALRDRTDRVMHVREDELLDGLRWLLATHQLLVEPTSAAVIAACLQRPALTGPTVVVLTGRNVAYSTLRALLGA
ncbi:MAG: pyridoxal-phosphate dependent enzyme [Deltaproteobacteria bacterium]|nr:pyridoxal-phosphate dependent enzyme [Deltaproteobacteria bacterium]